MLKYVIIHYLEYSVLTLLALLGFFLICSSNLLNQMSLMAQEHDFYLTLNKSLNDILVKNTFLNGGLFQVVLVFVSMGVRVEFTCGYPPLNTFW